MKRRTFIALSAMGATTLTVPFLNCAGANPKLEKILSIPYMLSHVSDPETIIELGKAYGTKMPGEYIPQKIRYLLMKNTGGVTISAKTSKAGIQSFIAQNIHADFESGETIMLKGWILSVTEARQCAFFSLTA